MPTLSAFPTPPARPLHAEAALQAQRRYLQRLQELRELSSPLAQLDAEQHHLAEWGLQVDPASLYLARERVGSGNTLRNVVRLYTASPLAPAETPQRWLDALHAAGFAYVSHDDGPHAPSVLVRKGLLHLRIDLPRTMHAHAAQTPAQASQRSAA